MAIVTFDAAEFVSMYPRFAGVLTDPQLQQAFNVACMLINNTNQSMYPYDPDNGVEDRKTMLYLLVCHLATITLWPDGQTGPVTSASEGSVSVSFFIPDSANASWFKLTPCGQTLWMLLRGYMTGGRYYPKKYWHPYG